MKTTKVEPNYNRQEAIEYLERWFDDWIGDEDWWGGRDVFVVDTLYGWDVNVFTKIESGEGEYQETGHWFVNVFGLEQDEEGGLHTRTETELDCFGFKITEGEESE